MSDWTSMDDKLPPEGVVVHTKIDDRAGCRNEQPLKRLGRLFFFEDGSMYVYYRPTHWRFRGEGTYRSTELPVELL